MHAILPPVPDAPPTDLATLWRLVLAEVELSVSKAHFATWFKNTELARREGDFLVVSAPNPFAREWLENKYHDLILASLQRFDGSIQNVRCVVASRLGITMRPVQGVDVIITKRPTAATVEVPGVATARSSSAVLVDSVAPGAANAGALPAVAPAGRSVERPAEAHLNPRYTFEAFVVGANNELAYAAAQAVARRPGAAYNPLFVYGGVGLGKTHLLQAIGNAVAGRGLRIRYVALETFMHELISAIQTKATHHFKERYRNVDVLIVDDIQFIVGREKTQDEFFHTFNELYGSGKQVVISSDRTPKAIPTLEERLRSRFEGGMIADIGQPDLETRIAILRAKCASRGSAVPEECLAYVAAQVSSNIRELEGMLNRILAHCELRGAPATLETTKEVLASVLEKPKHRVIRTERIIETVSQYFRLRTQDLIGDSRRKEVVRPRQIAMYLLRSENGFSFPTIGHTFGGKDHTTVMHACGKIEDILETNEELRQDILSIRQKLHVAADV